jgi:hypothetical protein
VAVDATDVRASNIPVDETLDAVSRASRDWQLEGSQVPPCLALQWLNGACSPGRHEAAFNVALFLRHAGKSQEEVQSLIYEWNARALGIEASEITRTVRNAFKPQYLKPPSCRHIVLKSMCVGEDCFRHKAGVLWKSAPVTPNGAMAAGLLKAFTPREWKAWCSLCELAKRKGLRPDSAIHFCYREIERIGGLPHQHQGEIWRRLEALGFIASFEPGPSTSRGGHSTCCLPRRLPKLEEVQAKRATLKNKKKEETFHP